MKEKWLFPLNAIFKLRTYVVITVFLGAYGVCFGQVMTITGQDTDLPLIQVTLSSEVPKHFAVTDANGQVDITPFKSAESILIRSMGYQEMQLSYAELQAQNFQLTLPVNDYFLDQVVVSATRWRLPKRDIPAKVSVLSKADIAIQNPQTTADLLGSSGEIFIQKSQLGGGSPMIRGFSTNRLLYTVDGVRMNTAIFRSGNLQNVISLDPFAIERTEIFFGPGSVIYGSDAIGGVMSFQTLNPVFSTTDLPLVKGNASTRFSSANQEQTLHFDVNIGWQKWALVTSFSHFEFDDLRMGRFGPDEYLRPFYVQRQDSNDVVITNEDPLVQRPSAYSQMNMMHKVRFQPNAQWDLQYGFHYSSTSNYARYDRHIRLRDGLPRSGEWNYGPQVWMMNNFTAIHQPLNGAWYDQMSIRLAYQYFQESRINRGFNDPFRFRRREDVRAYSGNVDFMKDLGNRQQLFYGVEAVYNDIQSIGIDENIEAGLSKPGPSRYPTSNWGSYATYLSYHYRLNEKFLLQAGARYNQYQMQAVFDTTFFNFPFTESRLNNGALSGSFGLVMHPSRDWTISANVATGFRSPNIDDIGKVFDSEPGAVVVPNPNLQAEYVYNAELGLARQLGSTFKFDFSAYYTLLKNALVRRDYSLNGATSILYEGEMSQVQAVQNAAEARIIGLQIGMEWKLPAGFGFSSQLNFQKGEEELDDGNKSPSRHAPPTFGISHFTYKVDQLSLDVSWIFNTEKSYEELPLEERSKTYMYAEDKQGRPYSPAWNTLNFKALFAFTDQWSASAGVENLFDRRYRPFSSGIVAPGRNLILSFHAKF